MSEFFSSGHAVDLIVLVVIVEATLLAGYHFRTGRGIAPRDLAALLLPGLLLLLSLRSVLTGADWHWTALLLTAAFAAHIVDLRRRWTGRQRQR